MTLSVPWPLLRQILLVVTLMLVVASLGIVGVARLRRLGRTVRERLDAVYPHVVLLVVVFAVNSVVRTYGQALSWILDLQITGYIYAIEGNLVTWIQSFLTGEFLAFPLVAQLTAAVHDTVGVAPADQVVAFFSSVYIYGYVFLMVFPIVAYLARDDLTTFRKLLVAYAFNYTIGVTCYVLFIAYGPRNLLYPEVQSLMYIHWPRAQFVTGEINSNTNVFPSLHSSISLTVAILAYRTRETYPGWLFVSVPLAACVLVATMFLGIHWGTDVVAGAVLAVLSIALTDRVTDENGENESLARAVDWGFERLAYPIRVSRQWLSDRHSPDPDSQ